MTSADCVPTECRPTVPVHLHSKIDREDLLQEVRARVLRAGPSFEGRSEAEKESYVHKTIATVTREHVRSYDREKRQAARERPLLAGLVSDHTTPGSRAARNELLRLLADALSGLPEDQRRAVELKHLKGLSLADTALRMKKSPPAVAGLLRRGLNSLRASLNAEA